MTSASPLAIVYRAFSALEEAPTKQQDQHNHQQNLEVKGKICCFNRVILVGPSQFRSYGMDRFLAVRVQPPASA
jgi:hypothetical protein